MTKVYCRCNGGHYFRGVYCPLDGWSSPESVELSKAVEDVVAAGRELSISTLREAGLGERALKRTIVIEFGASESIFNAISPAGYLVHGQWITAREFDERFL